MLSKQNLIEYTRLQYRRAQFELVEWMAKERADAIVSALLGVLLLGVSILGSVFSSLWLNSLLESEYLGFGILTLFWSLVFILLLIFRNSLKSKLFKNYANQNIPKKL